MHHDFHVSVETTNFLGGLSLGQVGHHGQRCARDRAAVAFPLERGEMITIERHAQRYLVTAGGIDLVGRCVHARWVTCAVLFTSVIQDDLLIQLFKTAHGFLSYPTITCNSTDRRSCAPSTVRQRGVQFPRRWSSGQLTHVRRNAPGRTCAVGLHSGARLGRRHPPSP